MVILHVLAMAASSHAQSLEAKWVEESQRRIEQIRKAPIRVLVLDDRGEPVEQCAVRIELVRHAFPFGVRIGDRPFTASPPASKHDESPVWRCFNAVSLDAAGRWSKVQPKADEWDFAAVEHALAWGEQRGLAARWGGLVSVDRGRMPDWAAGLAATELQQAMLNHARRVLHKYGRRVDQFDMLTHTLDHERTLDELGIAFRRRVHGLAESAVSGGAQPSRLGRIAARYEDAFSGPRLQRAMRQVTQLRESFIPVDAVAVDVRLSGSILEAPITRSLEWLGAARRPVILTAVEVAGSGAASAAINLETTLRAVFSHPAVHGVFFAGAMPDQFHDPLAALVSNDGEPTIAGELFDRLVAGQWTTDETVTTDVLGNARLRVFAGLIRITATLPGGREATAEAFVPVSDTERMIVLQPLKGAPPRAEAARDAQRRADESTDSPAAPTGAVPVADPSPR